MRCKKKESDNESEINKSEGDPRKIHRVVQTQERVSENNAGAVFRKLQKPCKQQEDHCQQWKSPDDLHTKSTVAPGDSPGVRVNAGHFIAPF